ncbi:MAG: Gfo/Idh/MocA family oxidoreductase [Clostridiales bacterium]|nr:Gfo/Idh/MocA family oxidoreductase [Clostridiales bacterium]
MENQLRMGIIGVGNIGSAHAHCIAGGQIRGMYLTALCDTDPDRRQALNEQYPDIPIFENHHALLTSGLTDGVIIATPHYFHPIIATDAFSAQQHVLSEKPAGVDTGTVREMNEAAKKSGKVFGIMFNQRTDPLFAKAREILQTGQLGIPKRLVWIVTNWYRTQAYYDSGKWRATWGGEGGGVLLNQAPHNLDLWQWIFGMPKRIRAFCSVGKYHRIAVEDDATIYAEYDGGATATFITTTGEYPGTNRLEIAGDLGKLVLEEGKLTWWKLSEPERQYCFDVNASSPPELTKTIFHETPSQFGHAQILQNFTDAVLHGEALIAPGIDGIKELTLSNAAYLSSWTDDWVELPFNEQAFEQHLAHLVQSESSAKGEMISDSDPSGQYRERWSVRW